MGHFYDEVEILIYLIIVHRLHLIHVRGKMMSERLGGARFLQQLEFPALFAVLRYRATGEKREKFDLCKYHAPPSPYFIFPLVFCQLISQLTIYTGLIWT